MNTAYHLKEVLGMSTFFTKLCTWYILYILFAILQDKGTQSNANSVTATCCWHVYNMHPYFSWIC